jgi:RimJ/RimL family protein N-acetyltransferase
MVRLIGLEKEHLNDLLRWRNDPEVRRWIFQKWPLSLSEQERWFNSYLGNDLYKVLIVYHEKDQRNIGYIRFSNEE